MFIEFFIPGKIEPKGRARSRIARSKSGKTFVQSYTPADTRNWEALVRHECQKAMAGYMFTGGPVRADITFAMPRPAGRPKDYYCTVKPDLDNLVKSILDACNLIAWKDDSCVSQVAVQKVYEWSEAPAGVRVAFSDAYIPEQWTQHLSDIDAAKQRAKDDEKAARQAAKAAEKAAKKAARRKVA